MVCYFDNWLILCILITKTQLVRDERNAANGDSLTFVSCLPCVSPLPNIGPMAVWALLLGSYLLSAIGCCLGSLLVMSYLQIYIGRATWILHLDLSGTSPPIPLALIKLRRVSEGATITTFGISS